MGEETEKDDKESFEEWLKEQDNFLKEFDDTFAKNQTLLDDYVKKTAHYIGLAKAIFNLMLEEKIQVGKFFEDYIHKWISEVDAYYRDKK